MRKKGQMPALKTRFEYKTSGQEILHEMLHAATKNLLNKWYPLVIDKKNGGYFTNISYDFKIAPIQNKMIVTQARQMWTASKAAILFENKTYAETANHGFEFLKNFMWDKDFGGFYQMRDSQGKTCDYMGFFDEKRTYGNAFGIYGLTALYEFTKNENILSFAMEAFNWIEEHAFDPKYKGYFQFLTREGKVFDKKSTYKTKAYDEIELGYKDQNSSIHLLEAYAELYRVSRSENVKEKLQELLLLIRDIITTPKGYLNLFFKPDWKHVSFNNSSREVIEKNIRLDHISFGHDYETAFLMLEASYALGLKHDKETLIVAKKMVDHAIVNGWDNEKGGFFDAGYYFNGDNKCTIVQATKNWWAQAEGLNVLLIMSRLFPENEIYYNFFLKQWEYIKNYLIDFKYGDWFEGGLDKEPHFQKGPKGHIWKAAYHTGRALMNCIKILSRDHPDQGPHNKGFIEGVNHFDKFFQHWKGVKEDLTF
jgi:cellobiose epimerase